MTTQTNNQTPNQAPEAAPDYHHRNNPDTGIQRNSPAPSGALGFKTTLALTAGIPLAGITILALANPNDFPIYGYIMGVPVVLAAGVAVWAFIEDRKGKKGLPRRQR